MPNFEHPLDLDMGELAFVGSSRRVDRPDEMPKADVPPGTGSLP
jgi:hypothetical protein